MNEPNQWMNRSGYTRSVKNYDIIIVMFSSGCMPKKGHDFVLKVNQVINKIKTFGKI